MMPHNPSPPEWPPQQNPKKKTENQSKPPVSQETNTKTKKQSPKTAKIIKPKKWPKMVSKAIAVFFLCSGAAIVGGGSWLAYQAIIDPASIDQLFQFAIKAKYPLSGGKTVQTINQIKANLRQTGLTTGTPLLLEKNRATGGMRPDIILPIVTNKPQEKSLICEGSCQQIVELRVYRAIQTNAPDGQPYYQLLDQLKIENPAESFVMESVTGAQSRQKGSGKTLPLTNIQRFTGKVPSTGFWFNLHGKIKLGNQKTPYGQIIYYNPEKYNLSMLLEWKSLGGQEPLWQEISGDGTAELTIDQTVGLDPLFHVYRVQPVKLSPTPFELTKIELESVTNDNWAYGQALDLARNGLWSPALKLMASFDKKTKDKLPIEVQSQLDLILFHAKITQAQAVASWASPSQQILANLIDGRWDKALQIFEKDSSNTYEIATMLQAESQPLWQRIEAANRVSTDTPAQIWGALLLGATEGKRQAMSWFREQQNLTGRADRIMRERVNNLLDKLDGSISEAKILKDHVSKIVGTAKPINYVNSSDWLKPQISNNLQLGHQQAWYQVQVTAFHDGNGWLRSPFIEVEANDFVPGQVKRLWQRLGLHQDAKMQIDLWLSDGWQKTINTTVKALQVKDGKLFLLAVGEVVANSKLGNQQPQPFAFTNSALKWLQPQTLTLADLAKENPQWSEKILNNLWLELVASGLVKDGNMPSNLLEKIGNWIIQTIDVTGNNNPDVLFSIKREYLASVDGNLVSHNQSWPHRIIFSDDGSIIYSELKKKQQFFTGLVDMNDGGSVALVVDDSGKYSLQRWSATRQKFE